MPNENAIPGDFWLTSSGERKWERLHANPEGRSNTDLVDYMVLTHTRNQGDFEGVRITPEIKESVRRLFEAGYIESGER